MSADAASTTGETTLASAVFYIALALLLTHELDAMTHHEWRLLPGLASLSDDTGRLVFVLGHVPLFAIVVGFVASLNPRIRRRARLAVAVFVAVHAGLHQAFTGHPDYGFVAASSQLLIFGAGALGLVYLLLPVVLGRLAGRG